MVQITTHSYVATVLGLNLASFRRDIRVDKKSKKPECLVFVWEICRYVFL